MSEIEIQRLAETLLLNRKVKAEMETHFKNRCEQLKARLKTENLFAPPPKGQKSPVYVTQDGATKVRLMPTTQARQWRSANEPLVLNLLNSSKSLLLTPEEAVLSAARFDGHKVELEYQEGRITEAQREALWEQVPGKEWRVSITQAAGEGE